MATPLNFYKIATMADGIAKSYEAQKYYARGGCNLVWPVSMVGGETTSGTEAFLLPWVSVAGVYLDSGGQYSLDRAVGGRWGSEIAAFARHPSSAPAAAAAQPRR